MSLQTFVIVTRFYDILITKLPPFRNSNHITLVKLQDWTMAYLHCRTWTQIPIRVWISVSKMGTVVIGDPSPFNVKHVLHSTMLPSGLESRSESVPKSVSGNICIMVTWEPPSPPKKTLWTDRRLWKHYLPTTSFAGGNKPWYVLRRSLGRSPVLSQIVFSRMSAMSPWSDWRRARITLQYPATYWKLKTLNSKHNFARPFIHLSISSNSLLVK